MYEKLLRFQLQFMAKQINSIESYNLQSYCIKKQKHLKLAKHISTNNRGKAIKHVNAVHIQKSIKSSECVTQRKSNNSFSTNWRLLTDDNMDFYKFVL